MSLHRNSGELFGHPKGLFVLFATEMWERMSYYGMRGIFVLYLTSAAAAGVFGWDQMSEKELQSNALSFLGTYAFLVYVTPVLGGWLADNKMGQRKAVIIGGILMAAGQFMLGTPHAYIPGMEYTFLIGGLTLLIIGNGFFKPNISTLVGDLYTEGDKRRDQAFTIFYMGINIGSILGYLIVGSIGEKVNFQYGFLVAGVGMVLSLIIQLTMADRHLGDIGKYPSAQPAEKVQEPKKPLTVEERDRIRVILIMSFFTIVFWAGFEQAAGSMNLFAKNQTDLMVFGWELPASWLQIVNPLFIVILAPVIAGIWLNLGDKEPSSPNKFALGMFFLGLGFLFMVGAALQIGDTEGAKAHILWLVAAYICHTIGELCLSPIGLSMVTKLSPVRYVSFMMGMWFFFSGVGNKAAAEIGKYVGESGALVTFGGVAVFAFLAGICLLALNNRLIDWMHGAEQYGPSHTNLKEPDPS